MDLLFKNRPSPLIGELRSRLKAQSQLTNALVWETPSGPKSYADWTGTQQGNLLAAVVNILEGQPLGMPDPPTNIFTLGDSDFPTTLLSPDDAWAMYISLVAQSLVAQIAHWVPWSFTTDFTDDEMATLFDSRQTFQYNANGKGYRFNLTHGAAVPSPPDVMFSFMKSNGLIGPDPLTTIGQTLIWCNNNLIHFSGIQNAQATERVWQYRGFPPVSRIINGTVDPSLSPNPAHYTFACHGTSGLLRALLRPVNIPVRDIEVCGHAIVDFRVGPNTHMYLSHGDDLYTTFLRGTYKGTITKPPVYSGQELLIDQDTYTQWFVDAPNNDTVPHNLFNNISRQACVVALKHLPIYLLQAYCEDLKMGFTPPSATTKNGQVFACFSPNGYSVEELEGLGLWTGLAAKVSAMGGPGAIPSEWH